MQELSLSYYFDLDHFAHAELFEGMEAPWDPIPLIESYLQGCVLGRIEAAVAEGAYLIDPHLISIGPGSVVEPGACIKGPCLIGRNCSVRHGAYIRGNVLIGADVVIGHATEVKNSVLLDGAKAPHFAFIGESIIGNQVNVGAGVRLANFHLRGMPIKVRLGQRSMETGLRKFGAVIGDGCSLGCNGVMNPGTLLGKGVLTYPCVSVRGFVPSGSVVKRSDEAVHG